MSHQENAKFIQAAIQAGIAQTEKEQQAAMSTSINGLIKAGFTKEQVLAIAQFQSAGMQYNQALIGHLSVALLDHLSESSAK